MKKLPLVFTLCLLGLTACLPTQPATATGPGVETIVASTLQAYTAEAPTALPTEPPTVQATGLPVSYNNVSFAIPLELNASASAAMTTEVEFPYINPGADPMPEHIAFDLTNYPLEGQARIMIFSASNYAAYGEPTQAAVTALLAGGDTTQPIAQPLAPGDFYAQIQPVNFQNGHGVRYLTEVLTGFAPINNRDIFYFYQGITNDGAYFVSAIFHVNASFLVADGAVNSPTPPDGVPFPWEGNLDYPQYLSEVTLKLNGAEPGNFTPMLASLDALVRSLTISAP